MAVLAYIDKCSDGGSLLISRGMLTFISCLDFDLDAVFQRQ